MAAAPQALTVRAIDAGTAARALAGMESLDPRGLSEPGDLVQMVKEGQCYELAGDLVRAVYVLHIRNQCAWVEAAKGSGPLDLAGVLDEVITEQASGLSSLGCQTARPGLVRKLKRRGWRVSGWVMRKDLQPCTA
jgi:hypothetical protein